MAKCNIGDIRWVDRLSYRLSPALLLFRPLELLRWWLLTRNIQKSSHNWLMTSTFCQWAEETNWGGGGCSRTISAAMVNRSWRDRSWQQHSLGHEQKLPYLCNQAHCYCPVTAIKIHKNHMKLHSKYLFAAAGEGSGRPGLVPKQKKRKSGAGRLQHWRQVDAEEAPCELLEPAWLTLTGT